MSSFKIHHTHTSISVLSLIVFFSDLKRYVQALSVNRIGGGKNDDGFGQRVVIPKANGNEVRRECTSLGNAARAMKRSVYIMALT